MSRSIVSKFFHRLRKGRLLISIKSCSRYFVHKCCFTGKCCSQRQILHFLSYMSIIVLLVLKGRHPKESELHRIAPTIDLQYIMDFLGIEWMNIQKKVNNPEFNIASLSFFYKKKDPVEVHAWIQERNVSAQCMKNLSLHFAKRKLNENGEKLPHKAGERSLWEFGEWGCRMINEPVQKGDNCRHPRGGRGLGGCRGRGGGGGGT